AARHRRRRREAALRGDRVRDSGDFRPRVRGRRPQLGAAAPPLRPALPRHRLQRPRLPALRRAGRRVRLFAGPRGGRHRRGAGPPRHRGRARGRPVDGRLRHLAFRLPPPRPRPLADRCRLRLRRRTRQAGSLPGRGGQGRGVHPGAGHGRLRRALRPRPYARAIREQGPARLRRIPARAGRARRHRFREHATGRAAGAALPVRPDRRDEGHARAHAGADGGRGLALPAARRLDEGEHPVGGAGGDAELRPHHQPGRPGRVQPDRRGLPGPGGLRPLADARPARDGRDDPRDAV
ncbi:MAG: Alpha/beta hydrolase fold, partial [uncultured Acetobacteraceae bacterium]